MSKKTKTPKRTMPSFRLAALPIMLGALTAPAIVSGCGAAEQLAEQCGLTCSGGGVLEGRANISGLANVDAFFGAVVDFTGAANGVTANIRTQLDAMALSVGLEAGAPAAEISAQIRAKIEANVEGGLTIKAAPPKCEASVEVTASAAASCDVNVDPGSVQVKCEGSCTIDASAQAECSASGSLTCKGQAPNLECSGTCTGDCDLEVAAACTGTCRGVCNGECSVRDSAGNCKGSCDGTCEGTCELSAGGTCSGKCEGSCEYTPPSGSCAANAEVRCNASAEANIECKGGCDGKVTPPSVSAECKASVEAKAEASVECTPPALEVSYQFAAGVNADAQADFRAWVGNFKGQFSAMLAGFAKAEILVDTGANLIAAADGAVKGVVENLSGEADLKASIGAGCALAELPNVATAINDAAGGLEGSVSAVVEIQGVVGGS